MVGRQFDIWARAFTHEPGSRRHFTSGMVGTILALAGVSSTASDAAARKKRKKKRPVQCPAGDTSCPKGYPSACCGAGTECCDTSRVGCCSV